MLNDDRRTHGSGIRNLEPRSRGVKSADDGEAHVRGDERVGKHEQYNEHNIQQ
jgi:hypothetical protein